MVAMSVVASLYQDGLLDYEQILIILLSFRMSIFVFYSWAPRRASLSEIIGVTQFS